MDAAEKPQLSMTGSTRESSGKLRFLLHSHFPAGHALPMQALAQALVARGHAVVWLTSPDSEARVRAVPAARFFAARALASLDAPLARVQATGLFADNPRRVLEGRLAAQVADYRAVLATGFEPHVLVVDVLPHGARALCDLAEVPLYATLGVIPLYTSNASAPLPASGLAPASPSLSSWPRIALNALFHAWNRWMVLPLRLRPVINLQRAALGLDALPYAEPAECFSYSRHLHLQASSPTLEFNQLPVPRQHRSNMAFVGPLVTRPDMSSNPGLPSWWPQVVSHERVIGITQGTLAVDPTSLIVPSIQALQHEPGVLVVVVSPHAKEIESRVGSPSNVRFAEWLPYHDLLPQLCLLITNGGYGSITQALSHRVPLICAGQSEDKRDTAARVVWSGAGVDLKTDSPSPHQVRVAARTVLRDASYSARARVLGDELNALGGAHRACDLLESLVRGSRPDE